MGRETPETVHQTPPFPTAAMMDLEDLCPLQVRKYELQLSKAKEARLTTSVSNIMLRMLILFVLLCTTDRQSLQEPRHQFQSVQSGASQQGSERQSDAFPQPER